MKNFTFSAAAQTLDETVAQKNTCSISVKGTFVATPVFEGSVNGQNWTTLFMTPVANGNSVSATTVPGDWIGDAAGFSLVRVRCTAYTSGQPLVFLDLSEAYTSRGQSQLSDASIGGQTTNDWTFACTAAIAVTSDVVVQAAAGAGVRNYVTAMQITNNSATATEIVLKDGSTVIWRGYVGASMLTPVQFIFKTPLRTTANAALNFACITVGAGVYISAQGFKGS